MKTNFITDLLTGEVYRKYKEGREVMDPNPIAAPLRFKREPTYFEQVRNQVKFEISQAASNQGFDTFEEANDFAIGDDFEPLSRHEETYGPDGLSDFERGSFQIPVEGGEDPPSGGPEGGGKPPAKPSKDKKPDLDSGDVD